MYHSNERIKLYNKHLDIMWFRLNALQSSELLSISLQPPAQLRPPQNPVSNCRSTATIMKPSIEHLGP